MNTLGPVTLPVPVKKRGSYAFASGTIDMRVMRAL